MPLFTTDSPLFEGYLKIIREFQSVVSEFEEFSRISKIVSTWVPEVMINSFFLATTPFKNGFKILNHGDDWLNNLMFKFNSDGTETEEVKLLDYQMSYWGSPAGDLFYFLISSVQDEFKAKHFDEFIEFYHSELVTSLKKLNFDQYIPTLSELWSELLEKRQCGELIAVN
jgi:thiamine kinase-like enzyme